jgi:hypothetical protein
MRRRRRPIKSTIAGSTPQTTLIEQEFGNLRCTASTRRRLAPPGRRCRRLPGKRKTLGHTTRRPHRTNTGCRRHPEGASLTSASLDVPDASPRTPESSECDERQQPILHWVSTRSNALRDRAGPPFGMAPDSCSSGANLTSDDCRSTAFPLHPCLDYPGQGPQTTNLDRRRCLQQGFPRCSRSGFETSVKEAQHHTCFSYTFHVKALRDRPKSKLWDSRARSLIRGCAHISSSSA